MIFGYTKLYSHREKAGISFEITNEKIRLFLSMLLLSGCHTQSAKRHLQDVLKMLYQDKQDILPRHLADVQRCLKCKSESHLCKIS